MGERQMDQKAQQKKKKKERSHLHYTKAAITHFTIQEGFEPTLHIKPRDEHSCFRFNSILFA